MDCDLVREEEGCDCAHGRGRLCLAACRAARSEERTTFLCCGILTLQRGKAGGDGEVR